MRKHDVSLEIYLLDEDCGNFPILYWLVEVYAIVLIVVVVCEKKCLR